ncbi:head GIN domain-containing protein [Spirosoma fluminis]
MNRFFSYLASLSLLFFALTSCIREDVGPYQDGQQTYALTNFNRLDMGSAFTITVVPGTTFNIIANGDRRNLDDLDVYVRNSTLIAQYRNNRNRKYGTSFTITMPTLRGVSFSGASQSTIRGFSNLDQLDIELTGASKGNFDIEAARTTMRLSGASVLRVDGESETLQADLSGASNLDAFNYPAQRADVEASGASKASLSVGSSLVVNASGASVVRYRGNPTVQQHVSGASKVQPD